MDTLARAIHRRVVGAQVAARAAGEGERARNQRGQGEELGGHADRGRARGKPGIAPRRRARGMRQPPHRTTLTFPTLVPRGDVKR